MSSAAKPRPAIDAMEPLPTKPGVTSDGVNAAVEPPLTAAVPSDSKFKVTTDLFLLWLGQFVSTVGDWCLWVAIPITIYNSTNSRRDLAFSVITEGLPYLIFSPIAGVIVDRTNRRLTMIAADIVRAALVSLLALPLVHPVPLWGYYSVLFCASAASAFFNPARAVIMTQVVPQRQLMRVNTLLATSRQFSDILGPPLGGALIALLTKRGAFLADTGTFLLSAACISLLSVKAIPPARESKLTVANVVKDIGEGLNLIWLSPVLKGLLIAWNFGYMASALFGTMVYAFCRDRLHLSPQHYGVMLGFIGIGYVCSGALIATALHKKEPSQLLPVGLLLCMVSALIFALAGGFTTACIAMFLFGFSTMLHSVPTQTLVQTLVVRDMLGRFSSAFSVAARLAQIIGAAMTAIIAAFSLQGIYYAAAFVFLLSAILAAYLLPKASKTV